MLVVSDFVTEKNYPALNKGKGDGFMIAGATLYGFSAYHAFLDFPKKCPILTCISISANATEEFFVRKRPLYEVVGQLGMWGFIINGIQSSALEWEGMRDAPWNGGISEYHLFSRSQKFEPDDFGSIVGLLMAFTCAMLILYTVAPMLYRLASAAFFNLSLLSSDFYGLLFGSCFISLSCRVKPDINLL